MIDIAHILILDMDADEVILWVFDPSTVVIHLRDLGLVNQLDRVPERRTNGILHRSFTWRRWLSHILE